MEEGREGTLIWYRSKGMGCMVFFGSSVCLVLGVTFTSALFFDFPQEFFGESSRYIRSKSWFPYALGLFYGSIFLVFLNALWKVFGITEFRMTPEILVIRKSLFFLSRRKIVEAADFVKLKQAKDGGQGEDSFPSWGLTAYAPGRVKFLSKEPIDKSDWLGSQIADYYNIFFERCSISSDRE